MYRNPNLDEKPKLLERRGGAFYSEAAAQLIASLHDGRGDVQVVDVRNGWGSGDSAGLALSELPRQRGRRGPGANHAGGRAAIPTGAARARDARPRPGGQGVRGARHRGGTDRRSRHGPPSPDGQPARRATTRSPSRSSTRCCRPTASTSPSSRRLLPGPSGARSHRRWARCKAQAQTPPYTRRCPYATPRTPRPAAVSHATGGTCECDECS